MFEGYMEFIASDLNASSTNLARAFAICYDDASWETDLSAPCIGQAVQWLAMAVRAPAYDWLRSAARDVCVRSAPAQHVVTCCTTFTSWAVSGYFFWNGTDAAFRHPDEWCAVAFPADKSHQTWCNVTIRLLLQANIEDGRLGEHTDPFAWRTREVKKDQVNFELLCPSNCSYLAALLSASSSMVKDQYELWTTTREDP